MRISVIIPTRNEEAAIGQVLLNLRQTSSRERIEIIVVDSSSSDRTVEIAQKSADKVLKSNQSQRAFQMHQGALAASGEILLFLHADTRLPDNWQDEFCEAWSEPNKPAATAFRLDFDSSKLIYRLIAAAANWRTTLTEVPQGDQAIAIDRDTYSRAGGFPLVPILEEYLLFNKLRPIGKVRMLSGTVLTSIRRYEKNGWLFNILRNTSILALFYLGVPPRFLGRFY